MHPAAKTCLVRKTGLARQEPDEDSAPDAVSDAFGTHSSRYLGRSDMGIVLKGVQYGSLHYDSGSLTRFSFPAHVSVIHKEGSVIVFFCSL